MLEQEIRFAAARVLRDPARRRFLLAHKRDVADLSSFLLRTVPRVKAKLRALKQRAEHIADPDLRTQALASLDKKAYHAAGAAWYAAFLPRKTSHIYIDAVVPLETIYDYLDNLCDRLPQMPPQAFPVLHEALRDALSPGTQTSDYFRLSPKNDGGYLQSLVDQTRAGLRGVTIDSTTQALFQEAATWYTGLQTYKHAAASRAELLQTWYETTAARFANLSWWEFSAAAGSQFHVYSLIFNTLSKRRTNAIAVYDAYFPTVCALHVLLDDFIDQAEDAEFSELNFTQCYASSDAFLARFIELFREASKGLHSLPDSHAHVSLLRIMVLFYLTHPKVYAQGLDPLATTLLDAAR